MWPVEREKIIWNFDNVQKAYATRGYEAKCGRWRAIDLKPSLNCPNHENNLLGLAS
jgi:hypothetical protein